MFNYKKVFATLFLLASLFMMISSVSAANFYVNEGTSQKDITDWMKNDAKTGDDLIFNTSSYNLTDQFNISKSINIKSSKNTNINSNQGVMFYVNAKVNVLISDVTLNHDFLKDEEGWKATILCGEIGSNVNIKNTVINSNFKDGSSIWINKGNIINCTINSNSRGINANDWKGKIINSRINAKEQGISSKYTLYTCRVYSWIGNMVNTTIISGEEAVDLRFWKGKIINSTLSTNGSKSAGINVLYAEGCIQNSKIISKNSYAVKISDCVKITNSSLSSKKGLKKVFKYLPDLFIYNASISGRKAIITIWNNGESTSKPVKIGLKVGKILKIAHVKSIKPSVIPIPYNGLTIKITLPKKFASAKYLKTVKVDYYNKIKETSKKNNIIKFYKEYKMY